MSMTINTNVASLAAQRAVSATQRALTASMGRLSSGQRINSAADDSAGLGISEKLKAQIRGLAQASRNANDGVSLVQVAEGAMNEQAGILTRLRELAVQASNATLGTDERGFIAAEATQLVAEITRISSVTEFNGVNMLGADAGAHVMQVGFQNTASDRISITFTATDATTLGVGALDYTTAGGAQAAIGTLDTAITTLSTNRSTLGAAQNRLQVTITNLASAHEAASAANSRIRDVDVADETAALTRHQILSQSGIAVLAQANQIPAAALSLLGR